MLLRFEGQLPNLGTASKLGIFQLAFELRDGVDTPDYVFNELQRNLTWLKVNLKSPDILKENANYRAISWFKDSARSPLERVWVIKAFLDEFGYPIDVIKTLNPGRIIYEDGWQVIAKPYRK